MTDITDASGYAGRADQVFTPRSEDELAAILARASSEGVPVTIMGALTGLAGGDWLYSRTFSAGQVCLAANSRNRL